MIDTHVGAVGGGGCGGSGESSGATTPWSPSTDRHARGELRRSLLILVRNVREEFCLGSIGADERPSIASNGTSWRARRATTCSIASVGVRAKGARRATTSPPSEPSSRGNHPHSCSDAASLGRVMMLDGTAGWDGDCSFGSLCPAAGRDDDNGRWKSRRRQPQPIRRRDTRRRWTRTTMATA